MYIQADTGNRHPVVLQLAEGKFGFRGTTCFDFGTKLPRKLALKGTFECSAR